jgi:hypothetical protein
MNKKINLEEILNSNCTIDLLKSRSVHTSILIAMKEAIRQTLELAAENANTEKQIISEIGVLKRIGVVDKQSITNTINQVE